MTKPPLPKPNDRAGFRRMYDNLVQQRSSRQLVSTVKDGDHWLIIRRPRTLSNVHVEHWVGKGQVALHLFGENHNIVGDAVPEGAEIGSTDRTRIYRWSVPVANWTDHPADQEGVAQAIDRALWCFEWVRKNRVR